MSEPSTELFERLNKFMKMPPDHRDESLWLKDEALKSSQSITDETVRRLVKSNDRLTKAIYIGSGIMIAVKIYFDYFHKP